MKNMKTKLITCFSILLTVSLICAGCCCLSGKPPCFSCGEKPGYFRGSDSKCPYAGDFMKAPSCILKNKEKLSLTAEQETTIKELCTKTKKDHIQIEADIETIRVDVKSKLMEDTIDTQTINGLIDKKFELKKQLVKSLINSHATLLTILTPEQRQKFKEIMKECKKDCCSSKGKCSSSKCSDSECSEF